MASLVRAGGTRLQTVEVGAQAIRARMVADIAGAVPPRGSEQPAAGSEPARPWAVYRRGPVASHPRQEEQGQRRRRRRRLQSAARRRPWACLIILLPSSLEVDGAGAPQPGDRSLTPVRRPAEGADGSRMDQLAGPVLITSASRGDGLSLRRGCRTGSQRDLPPSLRRLIFRAAPAPRSPFLELRAGRLEESVVAERELTAAQRSQALARSSARNQPA